jgi:hypothetical protein
MSVLLEGVSGVTLMHSTVAFFVKSRHTLTRSGHSTGGIPLASKRAFGYIDWLPTVQLACDGCLLL